MQNQWLKETLRFIAGIVIAFFALSIFVGNSTIDIHLHDTYFIFPKWPMTILFIPPGIFLTFLIILFKPGLQHAATRRIFIVTGFLSIIILTLLIWLLDTANNLTIYPPLSRLGYVTDLDMPRHYYSKQVILIMFQVIFLAMYSFGLFRMGTKKTYYPQ